MARKRAAQGAGTIRKKTVMRNGKEYTYWEARVTVGRDPGTGKQIQRSFSGKTQKEVREKMQAAAVAVNDGKYIEPSKMTVGQWLDTWTDEYLGGVKPRTSTLYKGNVKNHIKPALGSVGLTALKPHMVQTFINSLNSLSPGSIRFVYKILHIAMEKAVELEYIPKNPADRCITPKEQKKDVQPLDDAQVAALLAAVKGKDIENVIILSLFSGLRISEALGLTWDSVDYDNNILIINKQLNDNRNRKKEFFGSPKSGLTRNVKAAATVMNALKAQQLKQKQQRLKAGKLWNNEYNLVFTQDDGRFMRQDTVTGKFKDTLKKIGITGFRFHDLRHTYAVNSIRAGDDIKTLQGNLGHASAAFTLDKYGHFTERMKQDSASRMEAFIKANLNL